MILPVVQQWLQQQALGAVVYSERLSGGDICETWRIDTDGGKRFCVKQLAAAADDMFRAEAAGLEAIRRTGTLPAPEVLHCQRTFLALEYIEPRARRADYWQRLGEQLAAMHHLPAPHFGFSLDTYCGKTPQPNPRYQCGFDFFAEQRLIYQAQLAYERGLFSMRDCHLVERLAGKLRELIPVQPPCLVHGDLWSGNIHVNASGAPVLIDPAAYWGWAETDIAMTRLFGGFAPQFYTAYQQIRPLEPGWEQRVPIYNLYHLLNHLNLFGSSYYASVKASVEAGLAQT